MSRKSIIFLSLTAALLCLMQGCSYVDRIFHDPSDVKIARVGKDILYQSDIRNLIPQGTSPEDSVRMVEQYVNTWAKGKLMILQAEEQLSGDAKDINKEVAEFRQNLLSFRYEKLYIDSRLDTLVTDDEARGYYEERKSSFALPYSLVKARVIRISKKSPYYDAIKNLYTADTDADIAELEEICASAEKYTDFGKNWVPVSTLAKELGEEVSACESDLSKGHYEKETDGQNTLICILGRVAAREPSPFEYNAEKIRELIISKRKQEILASLERELFSDAENSGIFKIYAKDE